MKQWQVTRSALCALALGCGAQDETLIVEQDQLWPDEELLEESDAVGELGQVSEALFAPTRYGQGRQADGSISPDNRCLTPPPAGTRCNVPHNKNWVFQNRLVPGRDVFGGVDFADAFEIAVFRVEQLVEPWWDIHGGGVDRERVQVVRGVTGVWGQQIVGATVNANSQYTYIKDCGVNIYPDAFTSSSAWMSLDWDNRLYFVVGVFMHEISHCLGLGHNPNSNTMREGLSPGQVFAWTQQEIDGIRGYIP